MNRLGFKLLMNSNDKLNGDERINVILLDFQRECVTLNDMTGNGHLLSNSLKHIWHHCSEIGLKNL